MAKLREMSSEHATDPIDRQLADSQLLGRFVVDDDGDAFRVLVERHGPLVLSVCRRALGSQADADDAFQATFLVLAESATKIRQRESLPAWLCGVAMRISNRMRNRRKEENEPMDEPAIEHNPLAGLIAKHDARIADEEIAALPVKLRTPLVLRYLAGQTNAEVAEQLGITVAALEGRLKRAKQQLRTRLLKRGLMLTTLIASLKANTANAGALPASLIEQTTLVCTGQSLTAQYLTTQSLSTQCAAVDLAPSTHLDASTSAGGADPSFALQLAREEIFAMKMSLLIKPAAAIAALSGVAMLTVAAQFAVAQGDANTRDDGVVLQAEADAELPAAAPVVRVSHSQPQASQSQEPSGENSANNSRRTALGGGVPSVQAEGAGVPTSDPGTRVHLPPPTATATQQTTGEEAEWLRDFPRFADTKPRSDMEELAEAALLYTPDKFVLVDMPLEQMAKQYSEQLGINIVFDEQALDDLGYYVDEPVSVDLKRVPFRSALRRMLKPLGLTYVVVEEGLMITSEEEAETMLETRVYPTGSSRLADLIKEIVAPDTWRRTGEGFTGTGGEAVLSRYDNRLVIRQTYAVHCEINELILELRDYEQKPKNDKR